MKKLKIFEGDANPDTDITKEKVIAKLISSGTDKKTAEDVVMYHYDYVMDCFDNLTVKEVAYKAYAIYNKEIATKAKNDGNYYN